MPPSIRAFVIAIAVCWFCIPARSSAAVALASPFVDHAVLQRDKPLEVWGTAGAGASVTVKLGRQTEAATAAADGSWHVSLKPQPAGGPFDLTAAGGIETAKATDILIGDVWLCSGQSNMQMTLGEQAGGSAVASAVHPKLRLGKLGRAWTKQPQTTAKIRWAAADPKSAMEFSAVAYCFAHELESDPAMAGVPVGILENCLGGTAIESWMPQDALAGFDPKSLKSSMFGIGPTLLYNGMIAPLGRSSFAGVIWYQGEGNAGDPGQYRKLLPLMIKSWRTQFGDPALPFLVVQLPDYATETDGVYWQWIRESQAAAAAETPHSFLAVSINTNDGWNLHPQGKHEIGRRLAVLARERVYGEKLVGHGPDFSSVKAEGSKLVVTFDTAGDGLTSGTAPVAGFAIAGADGKFSVADAVIDGDTVLLSSPLVSAPVDVRYAWAGVPGSNLADRSGLPAAPFRTDTRPVDRGIPELQHDADGFIFNGADYQASISADGRITSLVVRSQQLISNAPGNWGGSSIDHRSLGRVRIVNAGCLVCENEVTSVQYDFTKDRIRLTVMNGNTKEATQLHIALNPAVKAVRDDAGMTTVQRKNASIRLSGVDRLIRWSDVAADDGPVVEADVSEDDLKVVTLSIN